MKKPKKLHPKPKAKPQHPHHPHAGPRKTAPPPPRSTGVAQHLTFSLPRKGGQHHKAPKAAKPAKPVRAKRKQPVRKLSPGSEVACCSAQALGTLLGWDWEQVLALYWRTAAHPDAGASIEATLCAALLSGMGRVKREGWAGLDIPDGATAAGTWLFADDERVQDHRGCRPDGSAEVAGPDQDGIVGHGLILGVDLPGSHALAVTPDGRWWSWGEPFDPAEWPDMVIEEAWAVLL